MALINTKEIAEEYRLSHWAQVMRERSESGLSIKAFCKQIGICGNTYFYWQRRLREAACEQMARDPSEGKSTNPPAVKFTEVVVREAAAQARLAEAVPPGQIHIEIGGIRMRIDSAYPADKLASLLREFVRPC